MRAKLAESPALRQAQGGRRGHQGAAARSVRPARQPQARADRLLRHHVRAGRGLVLHLLLRAGVPRPVARRCPSATKDLLLIVMTVVSAPLYVFFGWLSDRVGRKPVMVGGMLLALVALFPRLRTGSPTPPTRRWSRRSARPRSSSTTDPATCSVQFDPVGTAKFVSACDIAKSAARHQAAFRISTRGLGRRRDARRRRHRAGRRSRGGEGLDGAELRRSRRRPATRSAPRCQPPAIPRAPIPRRCEHAAADRRPAAVRGRRDRALRPAGRGAGRDVPDPHPLHRDVACPTMSAPAGSAASCRSPASRSSRSPAISTRACGTRSSSPRISVVVLAAVPQGNRGQAARGSARLTGPVDVDRLLGLGEHAADRQLASCARRRSPARAARASRRR